MPFNEELPEFQKTGTKPPVSMLNTNGWGVGTKPPADWFNWLFNKIYLSLKELQLKSVNTDDKGVANGIATLGADGKVPSTQINVDVSGLATDGELIAVDEKLTSHIARDGTLLQKGHVQLFSGVTSVSEGLAATPKAVKTAYDLAAEAKTQANDQKTKWASVIGSPLLASDTSTVLQSKTQTIKNDLATNLTAKGQLSLGGETLDALVDKVALVNTGKKFASGTVVSEAGSGSWVYLSNQTVTGYNRATVTGLTFKPTHIYLYSSGNTTTTMSLYTENAGDLYPKTVKVSGAYTMSGGNPTNAHIRGDAGNATVSSAGFTLPVVGGNTLYNWVAFE